MYEDLNEVISDAAKMNYSKASSSSIDVHIYKCKHRGCHYKRKYCRIALGSYFVSYFYGNHEHENINRRRPCNAVKGALNYQIKETKKDNITNVVPRQMQGNIS